MTVLRAFLDTCVLFKPILCDTLLSITEDEAFRPLWPQDVLGELDRNLVARGVPRTGVARRIEHMRKHFPEADVTGYDHLIPSLGNQNKDRHVLAAAIRGDAEVIVTENLRDFPAESLRAHAIDVAHQDEFLEDLLDLQPNIILDALARQASRYRRDPRTVEDLLITLGNSGNGCPGFAKSCHAFRA